MAVDDKKNRPHLFPHDTRESMAFTSVGTGGGKTSTPPPRQRQAHADHLLENLTVVARESAAAREQRYKAGLDSDGDILSFDVVINPKLKLESLENRRKGTQLLSFRETAEGRGVASVFVPDGQLEAYRDKVLAYRDENSKTGKPCNEPLITSIESINRARLEDLWTDPIDSAPPTGSKKIWWEVWVRDDVSVDAFRRRVQLARLYLKDQTLHFPGRRVFLVYASPDEMVDSVDLLNEFAEIRRARPIEQDFVSMSGREQKSWIENLNERLTPASNSAPVVCLLDTGVDHNHSLLSHSITEDDVHAYSPEWKTNDHYSGSGHGTPMAGFALYGTELANYLVSSQPLTLHNRLESVKILPPPPGENEPDIYGEITQSAVALAETAAPFRVRVLSMAVTSTGVDDGSPSSWSAAIDQICSGAIEEDRPRRLFFVSAGNADYQLLGYDYPISNQTDCVQDPAQAWNAISVGAFTERTTIAPPEQFPDWCPVASAGDMSPSNTTSLVWDKPWPSKPDIVVEGGNMAWAPDVENPQDVDSLLLLTAHKQQLGAQPTTLSGETSAATSIAAHMAARIYAEYPNLWPETVRALLIHSARWTPQMKSYFPGTSRRQRMSNILRCFGYGVPDLTRALSSFNNQVTLVIEGELQPFQKKGSNYKTKEMNLHHLPWPDTELEKLGETDVRLRVTLSYFIEPNPAQRGWTSRYRYMSHGLRFALRTPEETNEHFIKRINKKARAKNEKVEGGSDSDSWVFWEEAERGSVHSDIWEGSASDLLQRNLIAVHPVIGWWREYPSQERYDRVARYSLVVSIETDETEIDMYTEIQNQIEVAAKVAI